MADEGRREGNEQARRQKQKKQRSLRKGKIGEDIAKLNFYHVVFSEQERADLAQLTEKDLEDEIALLKVLIRRSLQVSQESEGDSNQQQEDSETIRRCIDTLCRAIRVQCSLHGKQDSDVEEATKTALAELEDELGITLQAIRPQKGVSPNDDTKQSNNQHNAQDDGTAESRG